MSILAAQPKPDLSWKQEVNQRLAAHKSRQTSECSPAVASPGLHHTASPRAAQAAARVAARYAKAPSYSQMLAEEARAAVRAAEAASQAALKAQAAAASVLAGLETVSAEMSAFEEEAPSALQDSRSRQTTFFDPFLAMERPSSDDAYDAGAPALEIRWDPELPARGHEPASARAPRRRDVLAAEANDLSDLALSYGAPETVEPALPIFANLIEFPRELVATRRARPRIAEGPLAQEAEKNGQLSIFEVDSGAISIEPEPENSAAEPALSSWSQMRLDPEPEALAATDLTPVKQPSPLHAAPFSLRAMAALVDAALIGVVFVAVSLAAASNLHEQPSIKLMEMIATLMLGCIAALYEGFFLIVAGTTPGMRYAGLRLRNFDGEVPSRTQLRRRLLATLLSLLPVGLGLLWAIFDEDHLCWHDRISHTYQQ